MINALKNWAYRKLRKQHISQHKKPMNRKHWIAVDQATSRIVACGICNCEVTMAAQPTPEGCELIEFTGGANGQYFINNQMQSEPPL